MISSRFEKWWYTAIYMMLGIIGIGSVFPFLYVVSVSLTPLSEVIKHGGFIIIPRGITLEAYREVLLQSTIPRALLNTLFITGVGTALSLIVTILMGFGVSKRGMPGKSIYLFLVVFTLLFQGGIIPTYLVVKELGLLNTLASLFVPTLLSGFNLLIVKTFFEQLPEELEDAAVIDGCSDPGILFRIFLPLSMPVVATVGLFYAVHYWNVYFPGILYITKPELRPLQVALQQLLVSPDANQADAVVEVPLETMKMAAVVVSTLPIVIVYPFLQKYFVKGATLGAIKG
jgi:putative aldouronate transport system permease protein